jgi:arsenite methyltransferase
MTNYLNENYDLDDPSLVSILDELPLWSAPFGLKLLDTVMYRPKMKVLDIGCGTGFPLIELANRLGGSCKVFGIDPDKEAIKRIELKIRVQKLTNVTVINEKAERMPFNDNFFHLIVSSNGINNVDDTKAVLSECFRVSRRKAQMVITVNLPATMIEFYNIFEETLQEQGKFMELNKLKAHIYEKRKPLDTTLNMIRKAGFEIFRVHEESFTMRYFNGTAMLNHFFIKLAFLDNWKNILSPGDCKPIFEILEQKLNKVSKSKGALNLTIPYVCIDCWRR